MSKKANTTAIGAFALGAIALAVAGVVVFGSGKFFKKTQRYVMYFDGSVKGLQVGSPVVIRGVPVGAVTDIVLTLNAKDMTTLIPVYAEIDPAKVKLLGEAHAEPMSYRFHTTLLEKGMRAQLESQSLVTGLLIIDVDFHPGTTARLVGSDTTTPEIPTIPTDLQQLSNRLSAIPVEEIARSLQQSLAGVDKLMNSPDLYASLGSLNHLLKRADALATHADAELKGTVASANKLLRGVDEQVLLVGGDLRMTMEAARESMTRANLAVQQAEQAMGAVRQLAAQNANLGYELSVSMEQMNALSRSMRSLTDYLDLHPEALVRGKRGE